VAFAIKETGHEATFKQFLDFLIKFARKIGSTYGRSSYQNEEEKKNRTDRAIKPAQGTL
jgi:hypothetical protein